MVSLEVRGCMLENRAFVCGNMKRGPAVKQPSSIIMLINSHVWSITNKSKAAIADTQRVVLLRAGCYQFPHFFLDGDVKSFSTRLYFTDSFVSSLLAVLADRTCFLFANDK